MNDKSLNDLYIAREKIKGMQKFAKLFSEKIAIGYEIVTMQQLKKFAFDIKAEIFSRVTQTKLRIVKIIITYEIDSNSLIF